MTTYNKSYKTCVRDEEDEESLYYQALSSENEEEAIAPEKPEIVFENVSENEEEPINTEVDASISVHDIFATEFNARYSKGAEFASVEALRDDIQKFAAPYNIVMTTNRSSLKAGKIRMICKHGGTYRAGKKKPDVSATEQSDEKDATKNKKRVTVTSKLDCSCFVYGRKGPNGKVTVRDSDAGHNHHIAADPRIYHINRRLPKEELDSAISLLQHRTPGDVLQARCDN